MASLYLAKVTGKSSVGLVPADPASASELAKLGDGECAQFTYKKVRSLQWHRLYFALCATIGQNQDPVRDQNSIDYELRALAGHYDVMMARKGNSLYECRIPKRIAFDKLTADEWRELWPSLELAGRERFGDEYFNEVTRL